MIRALAVAFGLLLAGCAAQNDLAPQFDAAATREMAARPDRYTFGNSRAVLVSRDGVERGLIWGTMHVGYDEATMLPRAMRDRFADAQDLTIEVDFAALPARRRSELRNKVVRAFQQADPAAIARLDPATRAALDAADLPSGSLGRFSLLGLSRLVSARAGAEPGTFLPSSADVDGALAGFARSVRIRVRDLETADSHIDYLFGDPNGLNAELSLRQALAHRTEQRELVAWIRDNYAAGRIGRVLALTTVWRENQADAALVERAYTEIFLDRHPAMVEKLDALFAEPGFHFVAVGAGHLLGEQGLPAQLMRRGWTITPCPGDRC